MVQTLAFALRKTRIALIAFALLALSASRASAFCSYPDPLIGAFTAIHADITTDAVKGFGFTPCAISKLIAANRDQDRLETQCPPHCIPLLPSQNYRAVHHFDRPGGVFDNAAVFRASRFYVMSERSKAISFIDAGDYDDALAAIGRALHAIQDFFAHSNYVDLANGLTGSAGDASKALAALLDVTGSLDPPASLAFTSYDPTSSDPELPADALNFQHELYSLDAPRKNSNSKFVLPSGSTKFDAARAYALSASSSFVGSIPNVGSALNVSCQGGGNGGTTTTVGIVVSFDPNEIAGPDGVGDGRWIPAVSEVSYAVFFSNESTATAPARDIVVRDELDTSVFDASSVSVGTISIGDIVVSGASAYVLPSTPFNTTLDLRPAQNLLVRVSAGLNNGALVWRFASIDPATGMPPADQLAGFLLPGMEGSVLFKVKLLQGLTTGTLIKNQASIVFDVNAAIPTAVWSNALDSTPPVSHIVALPFIESSTMFSVQWTGMDNGAGVRDYTVMVSDNGGPFVPFATDTSATAAPFIGELGHTYSFYSIARDLVGNVESNKTAAEATTTVALPDTTAPDLTGIPNDITMESVSASGTPVTWPAPTATDAVDGMVPVLCNPASGSTFMLGATQVNCTATDTSDNHASAHFNVTVHDTTPPAITPTVTGTLGANGWYVSDVTVSWSVTDSGSSVTLMTGCDTVIRTTDTTGLTVTCQATSSGGSASRSVTIKRDATKPTLTFGSANPLPNGAGWNRSDVAFAFTPADETSGVALASTLSPIAISGSGVGLSSNVTVTDNAGNTATFSTPPVNIDRDAPSINGSATPPNAAGWYNGAAIVSFLCTDALSGLAAGSPPLPITLSVNGAGQSVTGTCTDLAGNINSATVSGINIDSTAPVVTPPPNQVVPQTTVLGAVVSYPQPQILESLSGLSTSGCAPASGSTFPVGATTVTCTATDVAGNTGSATFTVTVNPIVVALDGRMFGAGFINDSGKHEHFVFTVSEIRNRMSGRFEYWVNDPRRCERDDDFDEGGFNGDHDRDYGREHRGPLMHFEATSITSIAFSDDPAFQAARTAQPLADTVRFSGAGRWNGRAGYSFEVSATDHDEPGRHRDTFSLIVRDASGHIVANTSGNVDGGRIESVPFAR